MQHRINHRLPGTVAALVAGLALVLIVPLRSQTLPQDQGAHGTWQKLLKLTTTASVMHTKAHPDDEHGGVITKLSRRHGARLSMITLNRGESGDNAIGSQLFDGLGLIRTEELMVSNRYYGMDNQYFTTVLDYGFSKRIDEALEKWGKDNVMRDVVRLIRMDRPFVLLSRFQGNQRDGHGNHQTAGLITTEAFKMAGDPKVFPEQIAEGLRPWQPFKVYIGGVREDEAWTVRIDSGEYSPWIGDSYNNFARLGLSFQRSQVSGRYRPQPGPVYGYYTRVGSTVKAPEKEQTIFDGIDTTVPGLFKTLGRPAPAGVDGLLQQIEAAVKEAMAAFSLTDPSAVVPALARGLAATRQAIERSAPEPDAVFLLQVKERQFMDAINTALGVSFTAMAQPAGLPEPTGMFAAFAPAPTMEAPVPGQRFEVRATFSNRGRHDVALSEIALDTHAGWNAQRTQGGGAAVLKFNDVAQARFDVTLAADVALSSKPYFSRASIREDLYTLHDKSQFGRPASAAPAVAVARYTVGGVPVEARETVRRSEARLPYGHELRELRVVPAVGLRVSPGAAIIPLKAAEKRLTLHVDLLNNKPDGVQGELSLRLPTGWSASPASQAFTFARAGERAAHQFTVSVPALEDRSYEVTVVARADGKEYTEGYDIIEHRDLETRYLYRPSTTSVRGVDVDVAPDLHVGYVMGVGDQVPAGIAQLGYRVTLLDEQALATGDLSQFDAVVTGTRAYAVREDLKTYNRRLLDYVRNGGNLVVLYNTQELVPNQFSPYPAVLPQRSEEVSEEDSPIEILAPDHQAFTWPNRITQADFEGWVEQRGSKFWSEWDANYTPMLSTFDRGQAPQRGGWLTARYGQGHYTYFAYAFHRQLPYGVPGAYRLLANVLALNKTPR
ncbi:MAG: PIG-L family deacetylase [Acidobacteria bacterium]|nr:PIG-L family deacetylase [Acidobacteriota bacterium]